MVIINANPNEPIILGKNGENNARAVHFDVKEWLTEYENDGGVETITLRHRRNGDDAPYECDITMTEGIVEWVITGLDVANAGSGECELCMTVNDTIVKSPTYATVTIQSYVPIESEGVK